MHMLYIYGGTVYTPHEEIFNGAVLLDGEHIVAAGPVEGVARPEGAEALDATGLIVAPGFTDVQFNGAFGLDFTADPGAIWAAAAQYPRLGVTAFLPTVITSPLETVTQAQAAMAAPPAGFVGAIPLGLHIEGPFLNPKKKGAHNPNYLRLPTIEAVAGWSPENGVCLVTLAPELPGALAVVAALAGRGVVVSAGHSMATYDEARAGFGAGIRYGTHLFNAMPNFTHRDPGLIGALMTDPRITVGFIADGVHTHPSVISLVWEALGSRRLNLVTDAMAALGMGPGTHLLGDYEVVVDKTSARLADGTLAGSILSLDAAVRNLVAETGCALGEALATVTTTPAALLGFAGERGQIAPGFHADLTLLTPELRVAKTVVGGRVVYEA
jgi:N-acetylglucosamine-6-phosphate deacetylase